MQESASKIRYSERELSKNLKKFNSIKVPGFVINYLTYFDDAI